MSNGTNFEALNQRLASFEKKLDIVDKKMTKILQVLNASPGLRTVHVEDSVNLVRLANGHRLYVDARDSGTAAHLMIRGSSETHHTTIIKSIVKKGDTVADIGAGFGYYSVLLGDLVGSKGTVYSFEPNPHLYSLLSRSIRANDTGNNGTYHVINKALGSQEGESILQFNRNESGGSTLWFNSLETEASKEAIASVEEVQTVEVEVTTLDQFISSPEVIDFCKIDAPGSERLILQGMKAVIERSERFSALLTLSPRAIENTSSIDWFIDFFSALGLTVYHVSEKGLDQLSEDQIRILSRCSLLLSKNDEFNKAQRILSTPIDLSLIPESWTASYYTAVQNAGLDGKRFVPFTTDPSALPNIDPDEWVVPVGWAGTTPKHPYSNLGDALSPVLVALLSGLPIARRSFKSDDERLACVGTIGHGFQNGIVHFWGTGFGKWDPFNPTQGRYHRPPDTEFHVHSLRGPFSAQALRQEGVEAPNIFGDPVWFLPSFIKPAEKRYELGVIVHISEITVSTPEGRVLDQFLRYSVPPSLASAVRIITTITDSTYDALEAKIHEITSCKRIVSTSLHGLVIAETYGIPCAYFNITGGGQTFQSIHDSTEDINLRMRDFYSGIGYEKILTYGQKREHETDWEQLIKAVDQYWQPVEWSAEAFLESFPLPLAFNPLDGVPFSNHDFLRTIQL